MRLPDASPVPSVDLFGSLDIGKNDVVDSLHAMARDRQVLCVVQIDDLVLALLVFSSYLDFGLFKQADLLIDVVINREPLVEVRVT